LRGPHQLSSGFHFKPRIDADATRIKRGGFDPRPSVAQKRNGRQSLASD
jgi:hypothetical protein